jgi:hypothetical protein
MRLSSRAPPGRSLRGMTRKEGDVVPQAQATAPDQLRPPRRAHGGKDAHPNCRIRQGWAQGCARERSPRALELRLFKSAPVTKLLPEASQLSARNCRPEEGWQPMDTTATGRAEPLPVWCRSCSCRSSAEKRAARCAAATLATDSGPPSSWLAPAPGSDADRICLVTVSRAVAFCSVPG